MKMKRIIAMLLCLAMLLAVTGCGSAKEETPAAPAAPEAAPASPAEPAAPAEKIVVNYWFCIGSALEAVVQEQIADFNASQDKIEVIGTFQGYYGDASAKIQQAIVAGTQPEIVMLERATVPQYFDVGALEDLNPYIERDNFDVSDFNQGLMNFSVYDGQTVSLPLNRSTPLFFYNKDAFREAGLDPDSAPKTWDDVLEYSKKLTKRDANGEITQYGIEFPVDTFVFQSLIPQAGGTMLNEDVTGIGFNNESGLAAFEYLMKLRDTEGMKVPPAQDSYTVTKQDFYSGKVAMMIESTGALKDSLDNSAGKFELGTGFLPMDDTYAVQTGGGNIAMLAKCSQEQKDAAWEFIKFMYSEESGAKFVVGTGYIPVTETIKNSAAVKEAWEKFPQYRVAYDQLSYVVEPALHASWGEVNNVIQKYLQAVIFEDKMTPQEALDAMASESEAILKQ